MKSILTGILACAGALIFLMGGCGSSGGGGDPAPGSVSGITFPTTLQLGTIATVDLSTVTNASNVASVTVNWGEGTSSDTYTDLTQTVTHTYSNADTYTINVTVTYKDATPDETGTVPLTVTTEWLDSFGMGSCTLLTLGQNPYWIKMEVGYQLVLATPDYTEQVFITVLDETEIVDGIKTRVIEEREFADGELKEISRNYFTICQKTNDVFYHGEDVDDYTNGQVTGHGGAWRAGVDGARAGLMMPGKIVVGFKHYQEIAPGVAMDRAEILRGDLTYKALAGTFQNCVEVLETSPLEPAAKSYKVYAPGIGMVRDDDVVLVEYGPNRTPPTGPLPTP